MKYIIAFICLFSCLLLITTATVNYLNYRPMSKRTENFGDDVCYYVDLVTDFPYYAYVKPCEEGKKCLGLKAGFSDFDIRFCKEYISEVYDNEGTTCETNPRFSGLDCTGYSCNSDSKCYYTCPLNQVSYVDTNDGKTKCIDNPGYCEEVDFDGTTGGITRSTTYTSYDISKKCIKIEPIATKLKSSIYQIKKKSYASVASIADGEYIEQNAPTSPSKANQFYCKSGYALFFFGNGKLENPNTDNTEKFNEPMFLRCVTIVGKDSKGIIKYKIGENGEAKYYNPDKLSGYSLYYNDEYLMLRTGFFKNYRERLDKIGCSSDTGDCEDNDLIKWKFFYDNPEYYYLYQNEPQVLEYLIQKYDSKYKAKHTSPDGSSLLNIKYLTLLSLLLLF